MGKQMKKVATATATTTTTSTAYTLKPTAGWELDKQPTWSASKLAVEIMSYRRQYHSRGIANFVEQWLLPTLQQITKSLNERGYDVAFCATSNAENGYTNYCFDVSKDQVLSDTLYVAHYDTVDTDYTLTQPTTSKNVWSAEQKKWVESPASTPNKFERLRKEIVVVNGIAKLDLTHKNNTDVGCLGADDGAGLAVMLSLMMKGVLGGYCFTTGEELGGVGADEVLKEHPNFLKQYKRSIEIDRRKCEEIIYEQSMGECASKEFTEWLCTALGMGHTPSVFGTYTDVATFAELIPENVNIASGYINAHSVNEAVDLVYLDELCNKLSLVDWTNAPSKRTAGDYGFVRKSYGYDYGYGYDYSQMGSVDKKIGLSTHDLSTLQALFALDTDFMRYALETGIADVIEYDRVLQDFYGMGLVELPDLLGALS